MERLDLYVKKTVVVWADTLGEYHSAYDTADYVVNQIERGVLLVKTKMVPNPVIVKCAQLWGDIGSEVDGIKVIRALTGRSLAESVEFYETHVQY